MAMNPEVLKKAGELIVTGADLFLNNKKAQKTILGTYSDGSPRSIIDALNGETISAKDKLLITKRLEESRKKKKKKKKKKNKQKNQVDEIKSFFLDF